MKKILSILLLFAGLLPAEADNINVNGTSRSYNVIVPKNLGENRPLLIFCHGYNQDAGWMQNSEFKNDNVSMEAVCDTAKFVCVFPNGIDRAWDIGGDRDINFVKAIIEKMVSQHKIDRNRIYLGGFSMGGMFTYNAINKMSDQIAAFISCSGPSVVTPKAGLRPIPLLHIQGTADNFGGVQPALNPWIKHNNCPTQDKVISNYNGFSGAKLHIWGPGDNGVEVRLIELQDKGHWICKEPQVYTGKEIWNFCKKYSLDMKDPTVKITSPTGNLTYIALGGAAQSDNIHIEATTSDPDGKVTKVALYDGKTLIEERTTDLETVSFDLQPLSRGTHELRVVATDDDQRSTEAVRTVSVVEQSGNYVFSKLFNTEGSVPDGWTTYDGNEKRTGYNAGYTSGCRVFHFTGEQHDVFEYGLYARNVNGKPGEGYARFAAPETTVKLTLHAGNYQMLHRLANWNIETFSPVTIIIEKTDGTPVYEETVTPTVNIGNNAANSFSGATLGRFNFDINETGRYQISFYTADAPWADLVVGQAAIGYKGVVVGIDEIENRKSVNSKSSNSKYYDLQGRQIDNCQSVNRKLPRGLYIKDGKLIIQ
ncbi:MAG: hypothetical protein J6W19_05135 [Prevotella sp.]|nr:hypothetical protein [Prevotella sp.]